MSVRDAQLIRGSDTGFIVDAGGLRDDEAGAGGKVPAADQFTFVYIFGRDR